MKTFITAIFAVLLMTASASAATIHNTDITSNVIMGSGIGNGGWTTTQDSGIELGLRAKTRVPVPLDDFPNDGLGTYAFDAGTSGGYTLWNFEWSINSNYDGSGANLDSGVTYSLWIDTDPTLGQSYSVLNLLDYSDSSFGDNSTAQGAGTEAANGGEFATLASNNNVLQNSWQQRWFDAGFDSDIAGLYTFGLTAQDANGRYISSNRINVNVGDYSISAVPIPAALPLFGAALLGIGFLARRRKVKSLLN